MKECKYCFWKIKDSAIKCKHCGEYQLEKYKYSWVRVKPGLFQKIYCTHCWYEWKVKTITPGSTIIELILWLCMIIPGLIYSWYRMKSKYCICPKCKSDRINLINK